MASRINLPDNLDTDIWAETGEKIKPDDNPNESTTYSNGYIAAPPINSTDNYYKNTKDNAVANIVQNGVASWNPTITYSKGSIVSYYQNSANRLYVSKINSNANVAPPLPNSENSNWIDQSNASTDQELQTFADSYMTKVGFNSNTLVSDKRLNNVASDLSLSEKQAISQKISGEINQTNDSQIVQTDSNGDITINAFKAIGTSQIYGGNLAFIAGDNSGVGVPTENGHCYLVPSQTNGLQFISNGSSNDFEFLNGHAIPLWMKDGVAYTNTPGSNSNDNTIPTTQWVKNLINTLFPVGHHLIQNTNPTGDGVHPGVWEQVQGDFSIVSGSSTGYVNSGGNSPVSGSANGHAITIDEMAPHKHTIPWGERSESYNPPWGVNPNYNNHIGSNSTDYDNIWGYSEPQGGGQEHSHSLNIKSYTVVLWVRVS